ncbi:MAG TPA: cation:proton antiporter [Thermoanaerobaculia bacterium]|nr:cation:proton antiporter [Thermoanaerobaculia bacterium]
MTIAEFLLALISIFIAAKVFGEIAERLGQPAVLGELLGGVIIGVSGFHLVNPHNNTIHLLSELGVILLLFLIGLETNLKKLMEVGGSASAVALVGVVLPFAGGFAFGQLLGMRMMVAVFLGAALTATSVGITARVLSDLGHLKDDESQVILGAAVVDDIIGLVLLTLVATLAQGGELTFLSVGKIVLVAFGFVLLAIVIGSQLAPMLIRAIDRIDMARGLFFASLVFALLLAWLAQKAGSAIIIGSFAAGLVLARTKRGEEIEREVHDVAQFFIPIFFVVVGAAVDLGQMNPFNPITRRFFWIGLALTAIGIVGKVASGFVVGGRLRRIVIGVGMIPRGEVGLIFATIGLSTKIISGGMYSAVAMMVMLTTFITPPLLRRLLVPGTPTKFDGHSDDYVVDAMMDRVDEESEATKREPGPAETAVRP